jgi:hypothetical protein
MTLSELSMSDQILLAILAATDAIFIPDRDPLARPRHAVIYERRKAYFQGGIPWASERVLPGVDETGRKQIQRLLDELALKGMVLTYQPQAAKTLGVRLSDVGEARARAAIGLPALSDALATLGQLFALELTDAPRAFLGRTWLPETALAGIRWGDNENRQQFVKVEEKLLPALTRGWAESNCSVMGHCWYSLTDAGRKQLSQPVATFGNLPTFSELAKREYYTRVEQERHALYGVKPEMEREIGQIPMPVCPGRKEAAV